MEVVLLIERQIVYGPHNVLEEGKGIECSDDGEMVTSTETVSSFYSYSYSFPSSGWRHLRSFVEVEVRVSERLAACHLVEGIAMGSAILVAVSRKETETETDRF